MGLRPFNRRMNIRPEDLVTLYDAAEPLITGTAPGATGYAPSPHSLQSAHHTGSIGNTQAPQFAYEESSGTDRPAYNANRMTGALAHIVPNLTDTYDIGTSTKWFRSQYVSQINAVIFAENVVQILGGWEIIGHDQGDFGAAVGASDTTIDFGKTMTPNDFILLKGHDTSGSIKTEYIQVGTLVSGTTYNVTRDLAAAHATDPAWAAGAPFLVLGYTGDGRIELNASDTPRIQMITQGATYNAQTELLRIGDLNAGWGYVAETWGIAIGEYAASKVNLTMDTTNGLRVRNNTTVLGQWATDGSLTIGEVAASKSNVYITAGAVQLRTDTTVKAELLADGSLLLGDDASGEYVAIDTTNGLRLYGNGALGLQMRTDGYLQVGRIANGENRIEMISDGTIEIINRTAGGADYRRVKITAAGVFTIADSAGAAVFTFDASAGAEFTKPLTLGTAGGIYQGTGTFASPTTGLKVWNDTGVGRIAGYNAGVLQWYAATDGKLYAGAGAVLLDNAGVSLVAPANYVAANAVKFTSSDFASTYAYLVAYSTVTSISAYLSVPNVANKDAQVRIVADADTVGQSGYILLSASGGIELSTIEVRAGALGPDIILSTALVQIIGGGLQVDKTVRINNTTNANMTTGLTINQGAADDEILAFKSSDVAHGMTGVSETDTYLYMRKVEALPGGVALEGLTEDKTAIRFVAYGTNDDTTKSTAARGYAELRVWKKSGTGGGAPGANANMFTIHNGNDVKFIFDADGDGHSDVSWVTYDEHDDVALLDSLQANMVAWQDPVKAGFADWLRYNRHDLEAAKIVHFDDDNPGHAMVNFSKLSMLLVGACKQLNERLERCERLLLAA